MAQRQRRGHSRARAPAKSLETGIMSKPGFSTHRLWSCRHTTSALAVVRVICFLPEIALSRLTAIVGPSSSAHEAGAAGATCAQVTQTEQIAQTRDEFPLMSARGATINLMEFAGRAGGQRRGPKQLFGKEQHVPELTRLLSAGWWAYDEPDGDWCRWMRAAPAGETP